MGRKRVSREQAEEIFGQDASQVEPEKAPPAIAIPPGFTPTQLAIRALMRRAEAARNDLAEFYRLVIRHETTGSALEPAPHQILIFSFVEAHSRCVIRIPIGCGKSFMMVALALWLLGRNVTERGAIVSKTRKQSSKLLTMIMPYITQPSLSKRLNMVFPHLARSSQPNAPWSQGQIVVERPPGIRDPSVAALGVDSAVLGARLSWLVADDTIDDETSSTVEAREKVNSRFDGRLISRLDPVGSRAIVTNTPWNREDLTYHLENDAGWPTITADIYGNISIHNAKASWLQEAEQKYIRPSNMRSDRYRLRAFDPDPDEQTVLWPERYDRAMIEEIRYGADGQGGMLPHEFAKSFLCEPFDEGTARCQREWIERCKRKGLGLELVREYTGSWPVYCGIDLAIGLSTKHDKTAFVIFAVDPANGERHLLWIESGRWPGKKIIEMMIDYHRRYGCVFAVENNGGQDFLRQWALSEYPALDVRAHTTDANRKRNQDFGIESLFTEFQNAAWVFPCSMAGKVHPELQRLFDASLHYNPREHVGDPLVALWVGRERARRGAVRTVPQGVMRQLELRRNGGGF